MTTYIYFVKCPGCEDEHFDMFDDAQSFAMNCLSQKPVITQTEVCRNDFGECTDSCDLGTVWSWEDVMNATDDEPAKSIFTKDDLRQYIDDNDPEFDDLDNSLDFVPEIPETSGVSPMDNTPDNFRRPIKKVSADYDESLTESEDFDDFDIGPQIDEFDNSLDFNFDDNSTETLWVAENLNGGEIVAACWTDSEDLAHRLLSQAFRERTGGDLKDCYIREAEEGEETSYVLSNTNLLVECDFTSTGGKSELTEAASAEFIDIGDGCKMSREAIYDTIVVNKNDIDIPVGDLGLDFTSVRFNDGGYYSDTTLNVSMDKGIFYITEWHQSDDGDLTEGDSFEFRTFEEFWNKLTSYVDVELEECTRKPVPEGMTIDQLKEAMEENEDTVECAGCQELFPKEDCFHKDGIGWLCSDCEDNIVKCTWCEELYDRSECRREVDLGWLCSRCEMGIKSRGETLTFREGSYWDDLDEEIEESEVVHDLGNEYDGGYPAKPVRTKLTFCPECGIDEAFDNAKGFCTSCGYKH